MNKFINLQLHNEYLYRIFLGDEVSLPIKNEQIDEPLGKY